MSTTDNGVKTTSGIRAYRVSSGVNTLALRTGGADAVTILDNGNVGIGTTGPRTKLDVNGNIYGNGTYAEIYVSDNTTAQSIPTGTSYTKLTAFNTNGLSNNCTADATNDKITITKTGRYRIDGSFNFRCGTNNVIWRIATFLGGTENNNVHIQRKISTAGDVGSASFTGFITVASVPTDLDVRARHDNVGAVNLTVEYTNLNIQYIGE